MRYIVQCGGDNRRKVDEMYSEIPELEEMHDDKDTEDYATRMNCHVAMAGFLDCMKVYESHVHLEDDAILCKGFKEKAEGIIAQAPNDVIKLFSRPRDKEGGPTGDCMWHQCVYFPEWFLRGTVRHFEEVWWKSELGKTKPDFTAFDCLTSSYMSSIGYKGWVCVPSLVQHADGPSSLSPRARIRRAGIFVDDLPDPDSVTWKVEL